MQEFIEESMGSGQRLFNQLQTVDCTIAVVKSETSRLKLQEWASPWTQDEDRERAL